MTFPLSLHLKKIESSVTFVPITGSSMSVNDYCRFCKINLRIQGILSHTRPIFQEKPTGRNGNIVSQCSKLGLTLHNTPLRSNRACGKCYTIITRMVRNIDRLNGWRKRESQKICDGEGANLPSSTLPLSSPASMEKPSRSSVTECFINGGTKTDHSSPFLSVEIPDQTKGHLGGSQESAAKCKMADSLLLLECEEEELEPWQQQTSHQHQEKTISTVKQVARVPAVRPVRIAPAPARVPVPASAASTHMVISGQTLSGNSSNSKSITVPMLTNTLTGLPAVVTPAPVPAPALAPMASTHVVLSGQTLSGNSANSKTITVPMLTNTLHLPTPMASVPVTALPSGLVLVVQQLPFASK